MKNINGIIPILKPPGMTSHDVVSFIRKTLNIRQVGHCGTLDPPASGVLAVCSGRATKISDYLMNSKKKYIAELTFGRKTDTLDSYGIVTEKSDSYIPDSKKLFEAINFFTGDIMQVPPVYSAIKINGIPLYKYARKNTDFSKLNIKPRKVTIYSIKVKTENKNSILFEIICSKGTYIRTLCCDIADYLGYSGYISFLHRSCACGFEDADCFSLDEISEMAINNNFDFIIPIKDALNNYNKVYLDDYLFNIITTGSPIDLTKIQNSDDFLPDCYNVVYCKDILIGIGRVKDTLFKLDTMIYIKGITL